MANIIKTAPNKTKKSKVPKLKMSKKATIVTILAGVVVLAIAGLLLSGRVAVVFKQPNEKVASQQAVVCDIAIVDRYNTANVFEERGDSGELSQDMEEFKKLNQDIAALDGYADDATCQTILFWIALAQNDFEAAQAAYKSIDELHAQAKFADSNLRDDMQLSMYPSLLRSIDPSITSTSEGAGQ